MTDEIDFDALCRETTKPDSATKDYENLFSAAFALSEWHFISNGKFPQLAPYCAVFPGFFDGKPMVAAFTDIERARKFAAEKNITVNSANDPINLTTANENVKVSPDNLIFSISPETFLDLLAKLLNVGVQGIFFNPDKNSEGFFIDLQQLSPIREHLQESNKLPKRESAPVDDVQSETKLIDDVNFDALAKQAFATNAREDLNALFGAAFALDDWQFIARGELPNINPYVASHPSTADNQPMVRAFTDGNRLMRFAKENNLTKEDGSCEILSIPTKSVVEYLEQFTQHGVHGVWFNSDTGSDGFFIPLKQLQPIKDHLEKLGILKKPTVETILVVVEDGLLVPSGFISPAEYACNFYCRVPSDWLDGEKLKEKYLEKLYQKLYGVTWRSGNSDGSRYVVIKSSSKIFSSDELNVIAWNDLRTTKENQYWFYIADANGEFDSATAEEFQKVTDAGVNAAEKDAANARQDRLADWGMSETANGEFEQNLTINQVGAVNFDTSIAPFYEAIAPLLADYQGSGEYQKLLSFDPNGMSDLTENIAENSHGAYLQMRRFLYLNPKNNVRIGVNSIHSKDLRQVQSNAQLLVSLELCKNLDNQTAAFYFAFLGPGSEVKKLIDAISPVLNQHNYESVSQ